ncbi:MAG: hypothetical protein U9P71_09350 [Campylobacterota bacterium]|nr:hypothetical protein [Campylobacterota bacterium]
MKNDFIPNIEPTPQLTKKECRVFMMLLSLSLKFGSTVLALIVWLSYDLFYGVASFLVFYLVIGIIRSKLLHASIPKLQQEYNYTDEDIASWYVKRVLVCE